MKIARQLLALLTLTASLVALIAFITILIMIRSTATEADRRTQQVLGEARTALERIQPLGTAIRTAIDDAEAELKAAKTSPAPVDVPAVPRMLLRSALKQSPGKVESASRSMTVVNDAMVVVQAVLAAMSDEPGVPKIDPVWVGRLNEAAEKMKSADAILHNVGGQPIDALAADETRVVETALAEARKMVGEVDGRLNDVHREIVELQELIAARIRQVTWTIIFLAFMGAAGQITLIRCCAAGLRRSH